MTINLTIEPNAVARVKDKLPIPEICRFCGGVVALECNSVVYGKEYGKWPYMYRCGGCGAYVGLHPNTYIPLGTLADLETRKARKAAKEMFIEWRQVCLHHNRSDAYKALAKLLCIPVRECHFGWFDVEECNKAIRVMLGDL